MYKTKTGAFSLVELSIVLVILGLLVGGVLAGRSLIRASELRAVGAEYARYQTAVLAFRDKYFALPGDMPNAQTFWGVASACPGNNTQPSTDATTCNGDADGFVEDTPGAAGLGNEYFRFWQHLANAGLVEGQYSGVRGPDSSIHSVAGSNTPVSKISNACWSSNSSDTATSGSSATFDRAPGNFLIVGEDGANGSCKEGIVNAEEIWNIDKKLDDSMPATGLVRPYYRQECSDGASSADTNAVYDLDDKDRGCSINFIRPF